MKKYEYLNKTVFCRIAPSGIHGVGVYAIRDIPKGQKVTDHHYGNLSRIRFIEMSLEEFSKVLPEIQSLILDRLLVEESMNNKIKFISPNQDQILQSFMNHSNDANTHDLVALRDISKGEEVTEDFADMMVDKPMSVTVNHHKYVNFK